MKPKPKYRLPDELPWWHETGRMIGFAAMLVILAYLFLGIGR